MFWRRRGTPARGEAVVGKLDGKVAIVTGTSRGVGVGVGIARQLLVEGATVIGCSRGELPGLPAAAEVPGGEER
jgi:NAD(P)-dependent dehydrogenase (short-subunit alcohol dehydrogenase family)